MERTATISEAAERTGLTPSALRFYDAAGLVTPARTPAGYRSYREADLTALRFIGRAKRLGLTLEEISEVVPLLDDRRCEPVQERLRSFVHDKIATNEARTTDLLRLAGQLRAVADRLGDHTPDGACDDRCGCTTDPRPDGARQAGDEYRTAVPTDDRSTAPVVCTLGTDDMEQRIAAWQRVVAGSIAREPIAGGVRLRLPRGTDLATVAQLVADEQTCCSFLSFSLTVTSDDIVLDTSAPPDGMAVVHALLGAPT